MRRAIAIVLSAILVTTPIKVVLAQADQQESQLAATDSTRVQTPARIGVPVVEPNSDAALLFTAAMRDMTTANDPLPFSPPYRRVSTTGKVVAIMVALLVAVLAIAAIACAGADCD